LHNFSLLFHEPLLEVVITLHVGARGFLKLEQLDAEVEEELVCLLGVVDHNLSHQLLLFFFPEGAPPLLLLIVVPHDKFKYFEHLVLR
jgi:hypothetical protein